jgi:prohibitin 1
MVEVGMSLVLLGVLIALALVVLGRNVPQIQKYPQVRWVLAILVIVVSVTVSTAKVVPPGNVGVLVLLGKVYGTIPEGVHLVNPVASMELMSVRTKEVFEHAEAPSREGLNVVLEISCLYHLESDKADQVYREIGPNYENVVVKPQFRSAIRDNTVKHESKDLYTSGREVITNEIFTELVADLKPRGFVVEKILLRRIQLPQMVVEAINAKLAADQQAQQMQFVLAKERQEAERKRIEAQGIQDFQRIISQGLTDQLLRWKGIETTRALAESQNTKTIIIGGRDGLPLILNTGPTGGTTGK